MAITSFNNQAFISSTQTPANLTFSVSGQGIPKYVELLTAGPNVLGIAFNSPPPVVTGLYVTLSVFPGTSFKVDRGFQGTTFAVISSDRASSLFTVLTGTVVQSVTANGLDTVTNETRRLASLGMF